MFSLLLKCFGGELEEEEAEQIGQLGQLATKQASITNPSRTQAAVAVRMEEVHKLVGEAREKSCRFWSSRPGDFRGGLLHDVEDPRDCGTNGG